MRDRWFAGGGAGPIPAERGDVNPPGCEAAAVADVRVAEEGNFMSFELSGLEENGGPCPAYVKMAWHPHWKAREGAGNALPVYRAGAGMAVLAPSGAVSLEYETGWCDVAGRLLSLLGLLGLGWLVYGRFRR